MSGGRLLLSGKSIKILVSRMWQQRQYIKRNAMTNHVIVGNVPVNQLKKILN
jgi:hypothetical protein